MTETHILDPLWITKGTYGLDPEYSKYILLAANKKYREKLNNGDVTSFYEILFHSLNLNNLAVEGSVFNFNMTPVWDDPKLTEIRNHLRRLYQLPEDLVEIFRNANYLLTGLMLEYLDKMLESMDDIKLYFVNPKIHMEKESYIVIHMDNEMDYEIWKLRFDKRYKFGHKCTRIDTVTLSEIKKNALHEAIQKKNNSELQSMDPDTNVIFAVMDEELDIAKVASVIASSLIFSRGIVKNARYEPHILDELYEILSSERILPFTMKSLM